MFKRSFKYKMILPTIAVMIALVIVLSFYSSTTFSNYSEKITEDDLKTSVESLKMQIKQLESESRAVAGMEASDARVMEAVKNRDRFELLNLLGAIMESTGVDFITVTDNEGVVLARIHEPENFGDSLANQLNIQNALKGNTATFFEAGSAVKVSVRTGSPVLDENGAVIGVISAGTRFDSNDFVDELKSRYRNEATIFLGDTRVATTIMDGRERVIGTQLNADIANTVLKEKKEFYGEADILGTLYKTFYMPLLNGSGEAFAIIFIGKPISEIRAIAGAYARDTVLIGGIGLIIAAFILFFVINTIIKPLKRLTNLVKDVASGNININTDRSSISEDEIGVLTLDVYSLIEVIKSIIDDLAKLSNEINVKGDIDYRIDSNKYEGSYGEMSENINGLVGAFIEDIITTLESLTEISNGNFDKELRKLPGKKIILNERFNELQTNLKAIQHDMISLVSSAAGGDLSARVDETGFKGGWANIMVNLNKLLTEVSSPINEMNEVLVQVANGNFDQKMHGDYKGDFLKIKNSINDTVTNIASYIEEISEVLGAMANNDLDVDIKREYVGKFSNIKEALINIIVKFNYVISNIYSASDQVSSGAKQISESSMTLAQGAAEQAASVEQLSATIQSINENTRQNAENSKKAEDFSDRSKNNAARGNNDMELMLRSMEEIKDSSSKIAKIIRVIEDIAFQTNLLALNAAVEAARAGVHGKGFSVVADEVRSLSVKTSASAKETAELIEESISKVNEGTGIAGQTAETLKTIVEDINGVAEIISAVATASEDQTLAINQVMEGIGQVTEVVQTNSATSEESASASEELASQSDVLKEMVGAFNLKKA